MHAAAAALLRDPPGDRSLAGVRSRHGEEQIAGSHRLCALQTIDPERAEILRRAAQRHRSRELDHAHLADRVSRIPQFAAEDRERRLRLSFDQVHVPAGTGDSFRGGGQARGQEDGRAKEEGQPRR